MQSKNFENNSAVDFISACDYLHVTKAKSKLEHKS